MGKAAQASSQDVYAHVKARVHVHMLIGCLVYSLQKHAASAGG